MRKVAFTKLVYTADIWPLNRRELTITAEDRRVVCESENKRFEHQCDGPEWRDLEEMLAACNFPAWHEEYYEPVLDGTHWRLEIHDADGQVKKSDGMNAYPDAWNAFTAICDYCARITGFETDEKQ